MEANSATTGGVPATDAGACPRALAVIHSDYASSSVSALSFDGKVLSNVIVSSAATPAGVTAALSGDVVFPLSSPREDELVLIDRFPNGVVTWIDATTGRVRAQLNVNEGFAANPHDYLRISDEKAYVTRYRSNRAAPGAGFDRGGDILLVDPARPRILSAISLPSPQGFTPNPDRMVRIGPVVVVLLGRFAVTGFESAADGALIGVDASTDAIVWEVSIPGMKNCGGLSLSPSGRRLAVSCSGVFAEEGERQRSNSDVILFDVTSSPPAELARFSAPAKLGGQAVGSALAFGSDDVVMGTGIGDLRAGRSDKLFALDVRSGAVQILRETAAFSLGDVVCDPGCSGQCFVADAAVGGVVPITLSGTIAATTIPTVTDPVSGLPPRALRAF